jgi:hypothetical protein
MRKELKLYVDQKPEIKYFLRMHPHWYRLLARQPSLIQELEKEVKRFHGKTLPQKVDKIQSQVQMLPFMLEFIKGFTSKEGQ